MKIKDIVDLKGCYSAHDVGELEVKLTLDEEKVQEIIYKFECKHERSGVVANLRNILTYTVGDNTSNFIEQLVQVLKSKANELIIKGG